ncbi:MAG: DUF3667 domain-containing protein [Maribacter sp.]
MDNTFLKTLLHLLIKPEIVVDGYIGGIRKKYLNPISYGNYTYTIGFFGHSNEEKVKSN